MRQPSPSRAAASAHPLQTLWSGALVVVSLALMTKASGALKEIALARQFGTAALVDQFLFAFTVATWPAALAMSVLTVSLTPILARPGATQEPAMRRFMGQVWIASVGLSVLSALALWLAFPSMSPVAADASPWMARVVGLVALLSSLSALATVILMCHRCQIGTLLEGVPSLVLGGLLLAMPWGQQTTLLWGLVLGMVLQLVCLLSLHRQIVGFAPVARTSTRLQWKALVRGLSYTCAGYAILSTAPLIELTFAGHFSAGSVASLGYAGRLTSLAAGLLVTVVNRVAIAHFCAGAFGRTVPHGRWSGLLGITAVFALASTVLAAGLIMWAPELVSLIYQRGQFDAESTAMVAGLMRWHLAQLPLYVTTVVLCARLCAMGAFRQVFIACLVCFCARVIWAALGSQAIGLQAIAIAPGVGYAFMLVYLLTVFLSGRLSIAGPQWQDSRITRKVLA